jgi:iron-chelate-transporting ATPase
VNKVIEHVFSSAAADIPVLRADGLTVTYGDQPVLDGLSIGIAHGKITALCGPNGCGKSTLLRSLAGLQALQYGEVALNGEPLASIDRRTLARRMTMLAQFNQIPAGLTVAELVSYGRHAHRGLLNGLSDIDRTAIDQALQATGLTRYAGRQVAALSGGERQRAWIAMALAQQCSILLLDEPTTYLDIHHQIDILQALRELNRSRGITIVWVLHDLNQAAAFSDHMVLMREGRILHQGVPDAMIDSQRLRDTFGIDMLRIEHPESGEPICVPAYRAAATAGKLQSGLL